MSLLIGTLLAEGIGDTLRVSLTRDPVEEIRVGYEILRALDIRNRGPEIISCPTCGRTRIGPTGARGQSRRRQPDQKSASCRHRSIPVQCVEPGRNPQFRPQLLRHQFTDLVDPLLQRLDPDPPEARQFASDDEIDQPIHAAHGYKRGHCCNGVDPKQQSDNGDNRHEGRD